MSEKIENKNEEYMPPSDGWDELGDRGTVSVTFPIKEVNREYSIDRDFMDAVGRLDVSEEVKDGLLLRYVKQPEGTRTLIKEYDGLTDWGKLIVRASSRQEVGRIRVGAPPECGDEPAGISEVCRSMVRKVPRVAITGFEHGVPQDDLYIDFNDLTDEELNALIPHSGGRSIDSIRSKGVHMHWLRREVIHNIAAARLFEVASRSASSIEKTRATLRNREFVHENGEPFDVGSLLHVTSTSNLSSVLKRGLITGSMFSTSTLQSGAVDFFEASSTSAYEYDIINREYGIGDSKLASSDDNYVVADTDAPKGGIVLVFHRDAGISAQDYELSKAQESHDKHRFIMGGLPSTELGAIVVTSLDLEVINYVKDIVVRNGFYIPVYDKLHRLKMDYDEYTAASDTLGVNQSDKPIEGEFNVDSSSAPLVDAQVAKYREEEQKRREKEFARELAMRAAPATIVF